MILLVYLEYEIMILITIINKEKKYYEKKKYVLIVKLIFKSRLEL